MACKSGNTIMLILAAGSTPSTEDYYPPIEAEPFIVYDEPRLAEPVTGIERNTFRKGKRRGKKFWLEPGGGK